MHELRFYNDDIRDAIKEFAITDPIFSFDEKKNVQMIADDIHTTTHKNKQQHTTTP